MVIAFSRNFDISNKNIILTKEEGENNFLLRIRYGDIINMFKFNNEEEAYKAFEDGEKLL